MYRYTLSGQGLIEAVCKLFERGTFALGEGDALAPLQKAYVEYRKAQVEAGALKPAAD